MRKFLFGFLVIVSVLFTSCGKFYTIGLMFFDDKDLAPTMLGSSQIEDALTRIRQNIKNNSDSSTRLPKWVARKVPRTLCADDENQSAAMSEKDEKKLRRMLRSFSRRGNVVFDYTCEKALRVLAPLYAQHKLIVVSPYGQGMKTLEAAHDVTHIFSTALGFDTETYTMLNFLAEQGVKRISVIDDGLRYSRVNTNLLIENLKNFDINLAFRGQVLPNGIDSKSLVKRITVENNDALLYMGAPASAAQFIKQLRMAGYANPIVLPRIAESKTFRARVASFSDKLYFVRRNTATESASFRIFSTWFKNFYAPLPFTQAVAESYVALEVALAFAQNNTLVSHVINATNTADKTMNNERIPTLFGDVYFDAQNIMRGIYHVSVLKDEN